MTCAAVLLFAVSFWPNWNASLTGTDGPDQWITAAFTAAGRSGGDGPTDSAGIAGEVGPATPLTAREFDAAMEMTLRVGAQDGPLGAMGGYSLLPMLPDGTDLIRPAPVSGPYIWWRDVALEDVLSRAARDASLIAGRGRVAVTVRHLATGAMAGYDAQAVMSPASIYKVGVMVQTFHEIEHERLSPTERILLTPDDWADGAGVLQARIGEFVTVEELLRLMIGVSDNTAAMALLHHLGPDTVNDAFSRAGLEWTRINPEWEPDTTTPADIAWFLARLAMSELAAQGPTQQMLDLLAQPQPATWIEPALPANAVVAHKSGQLVGVRNDAAIVYGPHGPYVLVVLVDSLDDDTTGEAAIGVVARAVHAYFSAGS